ncbi:MAG TPA: hypothetical protein DEQ43_01475 [Nocardioides bacterium]|nr:hypothetical protein [Nocardioides sp.]
MTGAPEAPVEVLRRWEASGGHWRVLARSERSVVVGLFSCDGGEQMHRLAATSSELDPLLAGRTRSDD